MRSPLIGRHRRRQTGLALACVAALTSPHGAQARERTPIHLTFVGAPGCQDRAALEREVERRTHTVVWGPAEGASAEVSVRFAERSGGLESLLRVERANLPPVTREIRANACDDLVEATALVIVVLLSQGVRAPAASTPAPTSAPAPRSKEDTGARPWREPVAWRPGGGTALAAVGGLAPGVLPGVEGFLDLATNGEGWAPAARVGVRHLWRSGFPANGARASFTATAAFVAACPAAWRPWDAWALRPCATGFFGVLEASGSRVDAPAAEQHPWAGIGAGVRLEARVLPILWLGLDAGSELSLVRSRFFIQGAVFREASLVTSRLSLSLAVRLR